jgi:hypothetical protein
MMAALTMAADFTTWDACEPQYSQLPFFSPTLKSMVAVGTFFQCDNHILRVVSQEVTTVGKKSDLQLSLNEFILLQDSDLSQAPIFAGPGRYHVEVVQTLRQFCVSDASALKHIVFVLSTHELELAKYVGGDGMEDLYVLRYRSDGKAIPKTFVAFPDDSAFYPLMENSYALEVYKDLARIADAAASILTRAAESQSILCTGRQQLTIHPRTWAYLKNKLNVEAHRVDLTTFRKRTLAGMKTATYSQLHKCEYLRFETDGDMDSLVKTLGPTSILGNRVKRPKIEKPFAAEHRSILNQVMGSDERDEWKRRTTNRGFDICSDGEIMRLYVRYERHILGSDRDITSSQLQSCLNYNLQAPVGGDGVEEEMEEEPLLHRLFTHGTQFEYHEEIFEIHAVSPERITAVPVDDTYDELHAIYFITAAQKLQLLDLIENYN